MSDAAVIPAAGDSSTDEDEEDDLPFVEPYTAEEEYINHTLQNDGEPPAWSTILDPNSNFNLPAWALSPPHMDLEPLPVDEDEEDEESVGGGGGGRITPHIVRPFFAM